MIDATRHATVRLAQRNIHTIAVDITLTWGSRHRTWRGSTAYFLGAKECRKARFYGVYAAPFWGTTLIVSRSGVLITAFRSSHPPRPVPLPGQVPAAPSDTRHEGEVAR